MNGDVDGRRNVEEDRLVAYLSGLVGRHGVYGAAKQLGVAERTLRRARSTGVVKGVLRDALERYVLADAGGGHEPWWVRTDDLAARLETLEGRVRGVERSQRELAETQRVATVEAGRLTRRLETRLDSLEGQMRRFAARDIATDDGGHRPVTSWPTSERPSPSDAESSAPAGEGNGAIGDQLPDEVAALVAEHEAASEAYESTTNRIKRLKAAERMHTAAIAVIRTHNMSWPPGQTWTRMKRGDEISWRWHALEADRVERHCLQRRRWLRRLLTLGLWWG